MADSSVHDSGISFAQCVSACLSNSEFVANWQRLRGVRLPASVLERMIDDASGHSDDIARRFLADVFELVYARLPREMQA